MINQELVSAHVRHFVYLQGVGTGLTNDFERRLDDLQSGILSLMPQNINDLSRTRLDQQIALINSFQNQFYRDYANELNDSLNEIGISEARFEANQLRNILLETSSLEILSSDPEKILREMRRKPINLGGGTSKLLDPFIRDWSTNQISTVNGIIRTGWFEGQTIGQMTRSVTESVKGRTLRSAETIIRTSINSVSQSARSVTWSDNDDIVKGWRFIATLDSRTSNICRPIAALERVYPINSGPFPPRHPNCRSTSVPELDDRFAIDTSDATRASRGSSGGRQVQADINDIGWLRTQPKEFVFDTIGRTRGEALLSGKMTDREFARFSLNNRFEALTIEELRAKDKRMGIGLFDQ